MSSISSTVAVHQADIQHKNFIRHQRQMEEAKKSAEESSKAEAETLVNSTLENHATNTPQIYKFSEVDYNQAALNKVLDENKLGDILNKVIDDVEGDLIFDLIEDDRECKDKSEKLLDVLLESDDNSLEGKLGQFFADNNLSSAQIFGALAFMLAKLSKRQQKKKKLEDMLSNLLEKFTDQNASYLVNYFDVMKNPMINKNTKLANGLAKLDSGEANINSIKSVIAFIESSLDGNFDKLISKSVRLRLHVLNRLSNTSITDRESITELSAYMAFVKNLLLVNSGFNLVHDFRKGCNLINSDADSRVQMLENKMALLGVIELIDFRVATSITFKNLLKKFNVHENNSQFSLIIKKILLLLNEFPLEFYNGMKEVRFQITKGVNSIVKNHADANTNKSVEKINIFKPKKELINFI